MAAKVFIPIFSKRKSRLHQRQSRVIERYSNSRDIVLDQVSNHDIYELSQLSRSPLTNFPKHSSSIVSTKDIPSSTPRLSNKSKALTRRRTISSSSSSNKTRLLSKISNKHENLRYLDLSAEDSCKNFNFVSTPPEENTHPDSSSPYTIIIEDQLNIDIYNKLSNNYTYINSPLVSGIQSILHKQPKIKMNGSFVPIIKDGTNTTKRKPTLEASLKKKQPKSQNSFYTLKKIFPACFRRSKSQFRK